MRTIRRYISVIPIFDADDLETAVPDLLRNWTNPLETALIDGKTCECGAPISAIATYWCWRCWYRFDEPNTGRLRRPLTHLEKHTRERETHQEKFMTIALEKRRLAESYKGA